MRPRASRVLFNAASSARAGHASVSVENRTRFPEGSGRRLGSTMLAEVGRTLGCVGKRRDVTKQDGRPMGGRLESVEVSRLGTKKADDSHRELALVSSRL